MKTIENFKATNLNMKLIKGGQHQPGTMTATAKAKADIAAAKDFAESILQGAVNAIVK